jgi:hypothetical protein
VPGKKLPAFADRFWNAPLELLPFWFEPNDGRSNAAIKDDA